MRSTPPSKRWKIPFTVAVIFSGAWIAGNFACATPDLAAGRRGTPVPAVPGDVEHSEGTFQGTGGVVLFEESWRPRNTPNKAAVVLMHGLKDHTGHYAAAAAVMAEHGYAVHAFDLRGHGKSGGHRVYVDSFDEYVADLSLFMNNVKKNEPGKAVFLFGHSMGGAIVTLYTITQKPVLAGLELTGPALKPTSDVSGFLIGTTHLLGGVFPYLPVLDVPISKISSNPQVVAEMNQDPLIYNHSGPARTAAELLRTFDRISEGESSLDMPLLVMHGTVDKLTAIEGSQQLIDKAASKDKTFKRYDGYFHDVLHEPGSTVVADMLAWMDARVPASPH